MKETKPRTGRPIAPGEKRTKLVAFYLTETDFASVKDYAERGGFKSTSRLIAALVEPVVQGGFSIRSAATAVNRIQAFMAANGATFKISLSEVGQAVLQLFTPPPPTIPDDVEDLSQLKADLRALLAELENQTTNHNNTK